MRIGNNYNLILINKNLADNRTAHTKALEPLSTGRRINHLSDDPSHLSEYFRSSNDLNRTDQYLLNIGTARMRVSITDGILTTVNDLVQEANSLALQGNNQTLDDDEYESIAARLTDIKAEILDLANTKIGNNYLFSGFQSTTQPFQNDPVTFSADSNPIYLKVTGTKQVKVSVDGDTVFTGAGGGVDVFETLDDLITNIGAQDELLIGANLTDLQGIMDQLLSARAEMGNASISLTNAEDFLENLKLNTTERIADLSEADIAAATADLSFREFTLESSFAVAGRIMELSLKSFFS